MREWIVDVLDEDGVCIVTYTVRIAAFNRTLNCEDYEREALWMASRDKIAPIHRLAFLTAKVRSNSGRGLAR